MTVSTNSFDPMPQTNPFHNKRLLVILFIAWLSLFAGINTIPVAEHEAYVLQTSREMGVTNDWVLPYFNQTPRLNKPPLNYWLTLGISTLDPFSSDVEPWHGRVWSMVATLLLVLMTAFMGNKLYGAPVGLLAAVFLLASKGFAEYSHDARPDFLYSALCVLQLFAWIAAWRAEDDSSGQRLNALLGWVLAALATLSKGPQVPAVFLIGFFLFLLCGSDRNRTLKVLRPFSGLLILVALSLPWWLLLQERIKMLGLDFRTTQLSGSLFVESTGKNGVLFYISRLLDFLLPVSLLLPPLAYFNRKRFGRPVGSDRLLLVVMLVFLVVFTLAGHQRSRYVLSLLPLATLLLAASVSRTTGASISGKVWQVLFWLAASVVAVLSVLLLVKHQYATALLLAGAGFMLILVLKKELTQPVWRDHPFAAQLLACSLLVTLIFAGFNAYIIRPSRVWERDFSLSVAKTLHSGDMLMALGNYPPVLPYYARHTVAAVNGISEIRDFYNKKTDEQNLYLLVRQGMIADVQKVFKAAALLTLAGDEQQDKKIVFVKVTGIL